MDKLTKKSIVTYKKLGIDISLNNSEVLIKQARLINGNILSEKELIERANKIFPTETIKAVPFKVDLNVVNPLWIKENMRRFKLKRSDIINHLSIDKSSLSSILSGERGLTKGLRCAFYYYFLLKLQYEYK